MPHGLAIPQTANRNAFLNDIRNHGDFRVFLITRGLPDMHCRRPRQFTEAAAKHEEIIISERLPPDQQHQIIQKGLMNQRELLTGERADISAFHLRTDRVTQSSD